MEYTVLDKFILQGKTYLTTLHIGVDGMKYLMMGKRRYNVTKFFIDPENPAQNRKNCNSYLESKGGAEGVIWASHDNSMIVIARNDDLGVFVG